MPQPSALEQIVAQKEEFRRLIEGITDDGGNESSVKDWNLDIGIAAVSGILEMDGELPQPDGDDDLDIEQKQVEPLKEPADNWAGKPGYQDEQEFLSDELSDDSF
jgi:hypothetical protein